MNMNVDINISLEGLHILETLLAERLRDEKYNLEILEKFGHDDVYAYQEHRIALMNGMLERLNVAYQQWLFTEDN